MILDIIFGICAIIFVIWLTSISTINTNKDYNIITDFKSTSNIKLLEYLKSTDANAIKASLIIEINKNGLTMNSAKTILNSLDIANKPISQI
jgi:hypothetical protein